MLEVIHALWAVIKVLGVLGVILTAIITMYALKEGLIEAVVGFGSIFFLIIFLGWHEIVGEQFMVSFLLAIITGLVIAFIVWATR